MTDGTKPLPEYLTVDEAANVLRVNRKTLYAAIEAGQVPGVLRLGRTIRLRTQALLASGLGSARPDGEAR